jgi:hypothetical protein
MVVTELQIVSTTIRKIYMLSSWQKLYCAYLPLLFAGTVLTVLRRFQVTPDKK